MTKQVYYYLYCERCEKFTLHYPVKVVTGFYGEKEEVLFACAECGTLRVRRRDDYD